MKSRPERQRRYFKAKAIKFNRKLSLMRGTSLEPGKLSELTIEGNVLVTFMAIDSMNRKGLFDRVRTL